MKNAKNIKTASIFIPNESVLKTINNTPTLKKLTRLTLKVGENVEKVNHYQFSELKRMYSILGCMVTEKK